MSVYRKALPYRKPQPYPGAVSIVGGGTITAFTIAGDWNPAVASQQDEALPLHDGTPMHFDKAAPFKSGIPVERCIAVHSRHPDPHETIIDAPWAPMDARARDLALPWIQPPARGLDTALPWSPMTPGARSIAAPWTQGGAHSASLATAWRDMRGQQVALSSFWRAAAARGALIALPWGPGSPRSSSVSTPISNDPPPDPGEPITVPIQAVYIMIPTLEAIFVPSGVALPILSTEITGNLDGSWAWSFRAAIAASAASSIDPSASEPQEVQITVNGYAWIFFIESVEDNRRFGVRTLTISGRSRSAGLAQPFAPLRTFTQADDRNASQLVNDELTPYGWTLVWDTVDWLVPGSTFTYQDLAPIDAIARVASSIGAAVLSDPSDLTLTVQPAYKVSPWSWGTATPYAILPASILLQGDGAWRGGTNANGVYVYSESAGYGAQVLISGTDGSLQIPMITERLTISADPARERGRIALALAGKIKTETRTIPLFPAPATPGLIPLGELLEITDSSSETWIGQVMGVRITADRAGGAASARQVLTLERQFR